MTNRLNLSSNDISARYGNYKYAVLYYISETIVCNTVDINTVKINELKEAFFFEEGKQLHIRATETDDLFDGFESLYDAGTELTEKKYALAGKFQNLGKYIIIREYPEYDEDGQVSVSGKALVRIE